MSVRMRFDFPTSPHVTPFMNRALNRTRQVFVAMLPVVLFTPAILPQVEQGRVVGRVSDAQNAVVSGAAVRLTNPEINIVQTATTDNAGSYIITPVPAGNYRISVSAPGFAKSTITWVELQVGQVVREDLQLQIGSTATTVEVMASSSPCLPLIRPRWGKW